MGFPSIFVGDEGFKLGLRLRNADGSDFDASAYTVSFRVVSPTGTVTTIAAAPASYGLGDGTDGRYAITVPAGLFDAPGARWSIQPIVTDGAALTKHGERRHFPVLPVTS